MTATQPVPFTEDATAYGFIASAVALLRLAEAHLRDKGTPTTSEDFQLLMDLGNANLKVEACLIQARRAADNKGEKCP